MSVVLFLLYAFLPGFARLEARLRAFYLKPKLRLPQPPVFSFVTVLADTFHISDLLCLCKFLPGEQKHQFLASLRAEIA